MRVARFHFLRPVQLLGGKQVTIQNVEVDDYDPIHWVLYVPGKPPILCPKTNAVLELSWDDWDDLNPDKEIVMSLAEEEEPKPKKKRGKK